MAATLTNIVKVTKAQMQSLQMNGYVTVNGVRHDYDANTIYLVEDDVTIESYAIQESDWT